MFGQPSDNCPRNGQRQKYTKSTQPEFVVPYARNRLINTEEMIVVSPVRKNYRTWHGFKTDGSLSLAKRSQARIVAALCMVVLQRGHVCRCDHFTQADFSVHTRTITITFENGRVR